MDKYTYDVEDDELLVILNVHGNLQIKGEDTAQVTVKTGSPEDLQVDQEGDQMTIRCESDCSVRVPTQARLRLDEGHGDVTIKGVEGEVEIKEAHGNLTLRRVGPLTIGIVHGNCEARGVYGNFEAEKIEGNLTVKDVQGELHTGKVEGNLSLENIDDGVEALVDGNAVVRLDPAPGQEYDIRVDGNIAWNMPEDASAEITIESAGRIVANLPGTEPKPWKAPCTIVVGDGDAVVTLKADGNIVISPQGPHLDIGDLSDVDFNRDMDDAGREIADQITQQIEVQMAMLEQQLDAHLSNLSATLGASGLSPEQMERIKAKAREASERANERAQERMRRAQERLERKLAAVHQRAEQRARQAEHRARHMEERSRRMDERLQKRSWGFSWPEPPRPPVPPVPPMPPRAPIPPMPPVGDPVSDEERLSILRMLQAKKITLEQAETLLAALEGKE